MDDYRIEAVTVSSGHLGFCLFLSFSLFPPLFLFLSAFSLCSLLLAFFLSTICPIKSSTVCLLFWRECCFLSSSTSTSTSPSSPSPSPWFSSSSPLLILWCQERKHIHRHSLVFCLGTCERHG